MTKLMILGTFHMQSQLDVHAFDQQEELARRLAELPALIDGLAAFRPTHMAVEWEKSAQQGLDGAYAKYLAEGLSSPNEIVRIAFPVAKRAGLDRVHGVDWMERGAAQWGCGDVLERLRAHQPKLERELAQLEQSPVDLSRDTLREAFLRLNSEEEARKSLAYYLNYARIGVEEYYGNGWLIWWYQRNLNIFTNLCALAEAGAERVMLLIGAAHKGILEQFVRDSGAMELVDVGDYL